MAEIIRGKLIAENIRAKAKAKIENLNQPPGLAAILVGDDAASRLYVGLKEKAAKEVGIYFEKFVFEKDATEKEIIEKIHELNDRSDINGILVQLPLPDHNENKVIAAIDPLKDVDGFHPENRKKEESDETYLTPPVALAVIRLIQATNQPLRDKTALIIGNHEIFAEPIIKLAQENGIEANFVPSDSSALEAKTRTADIIVVAVGKADFLTKVMVKNGAIVIDVGTNKKEGRPVGDAADDVEDNAAFVSPVPGGVGPLTVAYLLINVIAAAEIQNKN